MIPIPKEVAIKHLRSSCGKGDVLFWKNFPGKEKSRDSYFVLLTNCVDDKFLVVRATAQTQYYFNGPIAKRLEHDIVFIKSGETDLFTKNTIIDLTWRRWFLIDELARLLGIHIEKRGRLSENLIKRINQNVKESTTISERDQKIILQYCKIPQNKI